MFPYYLSLGMTYEEYWHGDTSLVKAYRKAYELKLENDNTLLWLEGRYIYEVLCDVAPLYHAFAKNPKPADYLDKPFPLNTESGKKRKEDEEKKRFDDFMADMKAWAKKVNEKHEKKEVGDNGRT